MKRKSYTLIEILVVIAIIIILISLIIAGAKNFITRSKIAQVQTNLTKLVAGVEKYKHTYGVYPVLDNRVVDAGDPRPLTSVSIGDDYIVTIPIISGQSPTEFMQILANQKITSDTVPHGRNPRGIRFIESPIITAPFPNMTYYIAIDYGLDQTISQTVRDTITPSSLKEALTKHGLFTSMERKSVAAFTANPIGSTKRPITTWGHGE